MILLLRNAVFSLGITLMMPRITQLMCYAHEVNNVNHAAVVMSQSGQAD